MSAKLVFPTALPVGESVLEYMQVNNQRDQSMRTGTWKRASRSHSIPLAIGEMPDIGAVQIPKEKR